MKTKFNSMALIGSALASVMLCYTVSLRVSAERAAVEQVKARTAGDMRDIRMLEAELRTRARLPELQRWNEQVLALAPPKAEQFLGNPVQLASFEAGAAPEAVAAPAIQVATVDRRPAPAPMAAASPVRQVAYVVPAAPAPRAPARREVAGLDGALAGTIAAAAEQERTGFQNVALR